MALILILTFHFESRIIGVEQLESRERLRSWNEPATHM